MLVHFEGHIGNYIESFYEHKFEEERTMKHHV